jgi:protein TonB
MDYRHSTEKRINEIVFENRNKSYGAYVIRREYDVSLIKSFALAMFTLLTLAGVYKLIPPGKTEVIIPVKTDSTVIIPVNLKPLEPKLKLPDKVIQVKQAANPVQPNNSPVVVDSAVKADPTKPVEQAPPQPKPATGAGADTSGHTAGTQPEVKTPYSYGVEHMPEFPGGISALMDYLATHIRYTEMAIAARVNGTLILRFVVGTDGSISDIEVLKKVGSGCESQAIGVVKGMPRWKPGEMGGRAVPVYYTLPIRYTLQE